MDKTFQQIWDFRRKDDDLDSMSDDDSESSSDEAGRKKRMLVHILSSPDKDEETDLTQVSQQNSQVDFTSENQLRMAKGDKESGKKRKCAEKESKRNRGQKKSSKVNQTIIQDQDLAIFSDFKTFTDSLLEELKVARKKMLVQMRRQITKLAAAKKPVSKPSRKKRSVPESGKKSGVKTQTCNQGLTKDKSRSNGKRKKVAADKQESRSLAVKKPLSDVPNDPNPHLCDIQAGISSTNGNNNAEKRNSLVNGNYLGIQPAVENLGSFDQITSY